MHLPIYNHIFLNFFIGLVVKDKNGKQVLWGVFSPTVFFFFFLMNYEEIKKCKKDVLILLD